MFESIYNIVGGDEGGLSAVKRILKKCGNVSRSGFTHMVGWINSVSVVWLR